MKSQHGGRRPGSGRKHNLYPTHIIKIQATDTEAGTIRECYGTRERTIKLLEFRCVLCGRVYVPHHYNCSRDGLCCNCRTDEMTAQLIRWRAELRRAEKAGNEASLKFYEWIETLDDFGWTCAYCSSNFRYNTPPMIEHFVSIRNGGGTTQSNCVPACVSCNMRKDHARGCKLPQDQIERVRLYLRSKFSDYARLQRGGTDVLCAICGEPIDPRSSWQPGIYQEVCCPGCLEKERPQGQPGA